MHAHRGGGVAVQVDLMVVEDHIRPTPAAIDRKSPIFLDAIFDVLRTDEIPTQLNFTEA